jgi:hypothetical protein
MRALQFFSGYKDRPTASTAPQIAPPGDEIDQVTDGERVDLLSPVQIFESSQMDIDSDVRFFSVSILHSFHLFFALFIDDRFHIKQYFSSFRVQFLIFDSCDACSP